MPPTIDHPKSNMPKWYGLLVLLCLPMMFAGLGVGEPVNEAEARCVEINRQMLASHDLLVPRLDGRPHLTKPPLFHWLSYLVATTRRQADLFNVRAAAALGGLAIVLLVFAIGHDWFGQQAGWWAAIIALTSYGILEYAHRGMFDTWLAAFVCLTIWSYSRWRDHGRLGPLAGLVLGLAGGFMMKGFLAWLVPLLPIAWDCWRRRLSRREARNLVLAVAVAAPLSLAWYVYLLLYVPEAREILLAVVTVNFGHNNSTYEMAVHREPIWFYASALPLALLPWLPLAYRLIRRSWSRRRELSGAEWLCWVWLLAGVAMLSLVPAKALRYLVPLLPAWCLLAGYTLAGWRRVAPGWLVGVALVLAALLGLGLPIWLWVRLGESGLTGLLVGGGLLGMMIILITQRDELSVQRLAGLVVVGMLCLMPLYYARWRPAHRYLSDHHQSPEYRVYEQRKEHLANFMHHAPRNFFREREPRIIR